MIYCNDLLTLSVLSLYEGELLGKVEKLYFDKKIKKLICIELIGSNGERYLLSSKNIYNIGKNAITVKNNEAVTLKVEDVDLCPSPIGSKAYTICGEYLGIITELSLNEKYLTQKFSFDNNSTVEIDKLASSGRNTTIFYDNQKKIDISKFIPEKSPKSFKTENIIEAQILPVEESNETKPTEPKNLSLQKPDFLVGRICIKDIFNFNNELLIKEHTKITKKNLKEITKYGKLRELMLYSK